MTSILISDQLEQSCIDILSAEQFQVDNRPGLSPAELLEAIPAYDALIVRSQTKVTAEVIRAGSRLAVIGRAGTGVDNIDLNEATRRGVLVLNAPGGNTISAAEHTISMMLSLARNIPQAHMSLVRGEWERKKFVGTEVSEKTLGIVGLGKIGREVAVRARALGMNVVGYDPVLAAEVAAKLAIELMDLETLFRRSDFITVHTPLTPETRGLLNDRTIALCKPGVRLINCARGGIIDEQALLAALQSGHVAGAALDVFEKEPPRGNPLLEHERVIATPHLGASTEEAQEKVAVQIAHGVADALRGRGFAGAVNGSALQFSLRADLRPYVTLAGRMGSFIAQAMQGTLRRLTVHLHGEMLASSGELVRAGVLRGVLSHVLPEPVNLVSAPVLGADMGVTVDEQREGARGDYQNLLRVTFETDREKRDIAGAVFGTSAIRLVEVDGFRVEIEPEGFLLLYNNEDRPGVLAKAAAVLARHDVNVAGVSLGRAVPGGKALTLMSIDSVVPPGALQEMAADSSISGLTMVHFPDF